MALEKLWTLPFEHFGAVLSESWAAFRGTSAMPDVPSLRPSAGLVGEAVLDRTFKLLIGALTGVPRPETVRRMLEEATEARRLYHELGWIDDPAAYHREPPPLGEDEVEIIDRCERTGFYARRYQHLRFESGYAPHKGEPGRERWLEHPVNGTAHAYVLQHAKPRPWLVCLHGFTMGTPRMNFVGFPVKRLHEELGLNLAFPVLPLHGPRGIGRMSGGEVLNPDYMRMVFLFAQAAWDVRRLFSWVGEQPGGERAGLYGVSLGAYVAALVASLSSQPACVIAGIPAVDFPNLARDNEPWVMRRYDRQFDFDWQVIRGLTHVVSPLALEPKVPRERRFIYAGLADRVVKPDQPRALWRHWDKPDIHWFAGGHVLGMWNPSIGEFLTTSLEKAGLAKRPRQEARTSARRRPRRSASRTSSR